MFSKIVKGKGNMETFFVHSKSDKLQTDAQLNGQDQASDPMNKSSSLAEVMYNMVQVIKKQNLAHSNLANSLSVPNSNKIKPNRLSLSFTSKQNSSGLNNALPLRGSAHSTRSAIIGDYNQMNQMKSSSCKLHRIKSEKPSRTRFTSRRKYNLNKRLSDGFTELNLSGANNLLDYARNSQLEENNQMMGTSESPRSANDKQSSSHYSSNERMNEKKSSLKLSARNCRSVSPTLEEQNEDKRTNSKKDKIDYL